MFLSRICYFSFWLFDNLGILSKIKLLKKNVMTMTIGAMFSWFVALILTLVLQIRKLLRLRAKSQRIRSILKVSPEKKPNFELDIVNIKRDTKTAWLTVVKSIGDLFPSGYGSGITLLLGNNVNDTHAGLGGLVSALVSCHEVWGKLK